MKFEKLGNIAEIKTGKYDVNHSSSEGMYTFYTCAMGQFKSPTYSFEGEAIILPGNGANVGQVFFTEKVKFEAYQRTYVIQNIKANSKFVYYYFKSNWSRSLQNAQYGSATNYIRLNNITDFQIPILPLETQLHIANILSKAESLIAQRKESIRLLDEYLKSVFLEMFGDPVRNEKKWKSLTIKEIGESRLGKMLDKKKIVGNNLKPYLRNSNVLWFGFKLDDLLEMDFDDKDKIEFSLKRGDVLMCEGGEIGRCAIWKNELKECYFQKAIHRIRLNNQIALPGFFVNMFWRYTLNGGLNKYVGTATISHLTGEKLKQLKLPIPPLELQTQFAQIVEKTEALKAQYQQSLQELENLYGSLSQKAFKGELSIKDERLLLAAEPETKYGEK